MSRDGYLPPGCTEKDVDMSAPGYWDERPDPVQEAMDYQEQQQREFEEHEYRRISRAMFYELGEHFVEGDEVDRIWLKWQMAVWDERLK